MRRRHRLSVDTFPFLAVLLCAMGALILILLVMDRRSRLAAMARARDSALQAIRESEEEVVPTEEDKRIEAENKALDAEMHRVQARLAAVAQDLRREEVGVNTLRRTVQAKQIDLKGHERAFQAAQKEAVVLKANLTMEDRARNELAAQLVQLEQVIRDLQSARQRDALTYSVIPYKGKHGEQRRPLYVECTGIGFLFHPDRFEMIDPSTLLLSEEINRRVDRIAQNRQRAGRPAERPYLMMLIRPEGIMRYYQIQAAVRDLPVEFGYEVVDADWVLAIPPEHDELAGMAEPSLSKPTPSEPNRNSSVGSGTSVGTAGGGAGGGSSLPGGNSRGGGNAVAGFSDGTNRGNGFGLPGNAPGGSGGSGWPGGGSRGNATAGGLFGNPSGGPGSRSPGGSVGGLFGNASGGSGEPGGPGGPGGRSSGNSTAGGSGSIAKNGGSGLPGSTMGQPDGISGSGSPDGRNLPGGSASGLGGSGGPGGPGQATAGLGGGSTGPSLFGGTGPNRSPPGALAMLSGPGGGTQGSSPSPIPGLGGGSGGAGIANPDAPLKPIFDNSLSLNTSNAIAKASSAIQIPSILPNLTANIGGAGNASAGGAGNASGGGAGNASAGGAGNASGGGAGNSSGGSGSPSGGSGSPSGGSGNASGGSGNASESAGTPPAGAGSPPAGAGNTATGAGSPPPGATPPPGGATPPAAAGIPPTIVVTAPKSAGTPPAPSSGRSSSGGSPGGGGGEGGDRVQREGFHGADSLAPARPRSRPLLPARIGASEDTILFIECRSTGVVVYPVGQSIPFAALDREPANNPLYQTVMAQLALHKGDPERRHIRFLIHRDAERTFHTAYPVLDNVKVDKTRYTVQPGDEISRLTQVD
jgi:hypothetical protein